ncbi:MAG: hypothetical protein KA761_06680, partial [Gemmatimonadaceae bacterium]|nr:hypothetical protein [Gemmatimonadaceae bacterium]
MSGGRMTRRTIALAGAVGLVLGGLAARASAQAPVAADTGSSWLSRRLGGQAQVFSEMYGISGMDRRRPGSTWRIMASPRLGI